MSHGRVAVIIFFVVEDGIIFVFFFGVPFSMSASSAAALSASSWN